MSNRLAILTIHSDFLVEMLRGHPLCAMSSNVPADLVIRHIYRVLGVMRFIVESSMFAPVAEGAVPPEWTPTFTKTMSEHDGLLAAMTRCPECPDCTGPDHYAAVRRIVR